MVRLLVIMRYLGMPEPVNKSYLPLASCSLEVS